MLSNVSTKERLIYIGGLALLLFVAGFIGRSYATRPADIVFEKQEEKALEPAKPAEVQVHVAGCVAKPGLYRLSSDSRVNDALVLAGGAKPQADIEQINLAAKLVDGTQLYVPSKAPAEAGKVAEPYQGGPRSAAAQTYFARPVDVKSSSSGTKNPAPNSISLNTASLAQLEQLPGVGPATAQKILDYRQEHGGFSSIDELMAVKGIGPKKLEAMRKYLKL